ncbi:MAG TPA: phospho-N-acetylmuramoyl-pentapeptide-transferase [Actinomycetes bacterium]|nr:phospho-N-acetylmuramoyl-pentapeptide-transferase [Actinomycetes bacterium]
MVGILMAATVALIVGLIGTPIAIRVFRARHLGQLIQVDLPDSHQTKRGTPTMGGLVMVGGAVAGYLSVHNRLTDVDFSRGGIMVVGTMVALGLVGFADDYLKVRNSRSLGLTKTAKFTGQALCALGLALGAWYWADAWHGLSFIRPLSGTQMILLAFVVWVFLIVAAASNSVNLTDGMDGLASGTTTLVMAAYVVITFWQFRHACTLTPVNSPGCYQISTAEARDLAVAAAAMMGACAGFLWWNAPPARIFMGDTGSLALGGMLAALSLFTDTQLLLVVLGGLYVVETLSVILQIGSFRLFRRRVFRMAPLHLHFELQDWPETTVIVRFWILGGLAVAFGLGLFYAEFLATGGSGG